MKLKFKALTISCALIISICSICFTGCLKSEWQFEQSMDNIESIEIVSVSNKYEVVTGNEELITVLNIETLKTIYRPEAQELAKSIQILQARRYLGDPGKCYGMGFKVVFENGDFDLITEREPKHFYNTDNGITHNGYISFLTFHNNAEFYKLIGKWR